MTQKETRKSGAAAGTIAVKRGSTQPFQSEEAPASLLPSDVSPDNAVTPASLTKITESDRRVKVAGPKATDKTVGRKGGSARGERTKADTVLKKLQLARGATVAQLMEATGWQAHSVRGFLSGTIRKKLGFNLVSVIGRDGMRRYRIIADN